MIFFWKMHFKNISTITLKTYQHSTERLQSTILVATAWYVCKKLSLVCYLSVFVRIFFCGFHMFLFPKMIFLPIHEHCYVFYVWMCVFSLVTTSNMHNIRHITNQNISILCSKYHCTWYFQIIDLPQPKKKFNFFFNQICFLGYKGPQKLACIIAPSNKSVHCYNPSVNPIKYR